MPCVDNVCGTGDWSGPVPGDPSNNSILSATPANEGIIVSWTYPTIMPYAVLHTWLYRGTSSDFNLAVRQQIVAGSSYFDRIPQGEHREYFYWIILISVNGTQGDPIGPASAYPLSGILQTIKDLTGLIDDGVLSQALRAKLDQIVFLQNSLDAATLKHLNDNEALSNALAAVQSETGEAMTYIQNEIIRRQDADQALIDSTNSMAVGIAESAAAIVEESFLRSSADSAIALQVTTVQTNLNGNIATVQTNLQTAINTTNDMVTSIGALYTAKVDVNGLIGGFGIYNDGTYVEAGFDVDRFWIGRTTDKVKPFIVNNGTVYIANAVIQDASITNAKIKNLSVDTLKIAGNAVTVPSSGEAYGSVPSVTITIDIPLNEAATVFVTVGANALASAGGAGSFYVSVNHVGEGGKGQMGISLDSGYSGAITTAAQFTVGAGTHTFTLAVTLPSGRSLGWCYINVLGVKK